jgi:CRP/FNR family transcriptional regulator, cyclic AMP receptor protein
MKTQDEERRPFDPKVFLAKADGGKTITDYHERQVVFSQADPADSIFGSSEKSVG